MAEGVAVKENPHLEFPDIIRESDGDGDFELRLWQPEHAEALTELVTDNLDHLRPYMPWIIAEPMASEDRAEILNRWYQGAKDCSGDGVYGAFFQGLPIGSCGLHRRVGPDGLEIGYWVDRHQVKKGFATRLTRMLTDHAFTHPEVSMVEIHHDETNQASKAVPTRLGFVLVESRAVPAQAPGETGTSCIWRMEREAWARPLSTTSDL